MLLQTLVIRNCCIDLAETFNLLKELPQLTRLELGGTEDSGIKLFKGLTYRPPLIKLLLHLLSYYLVWHIFSYADEEAASLETIFDMLEPRLEPDSAGGFPCAQLCWFEIDDPKPYPDETEALARWLGKLDSGILGKFEEK